MKDMKYLKLMILVDSVEEALLAEDAGVDRAFFDLEYIGKSERQYGRNTVISNNNIDDLARIRKSLNSTELLVRTNPVGPYTKFEVDKAINYGADILMLPMVIDHHDVETFIKLVDGRARTCIMVETASALARIDKILAVPGVDEIFIGLNDLHISMGLSFMFELLSGGIVEYLAEKCSSKGIPFGFGGIARIGEGVLPSDSILGEHVRLGSMSVILSRTFKGIKGVDANSHQINLKEEVVKVRNRIIEINNWEEQEYIENRRFIDSTIDTIVSKISLAK